MLKRYLHKNLIEAGCDEAGRGCLVGPVFAAAVILPKKGIPRALNDSKKLKEKDREKLRKWIEKNAIDYYVAQVSPAEIDKINILNASFKAMHIAIENLKQSPEHLLIDGNRFNPYKKYQYTCVIKGDGKYTSIAAASILAKTYRDDYMKKISIEYPDYQWDKNKGYPTLKHRIATLNLGKTPYHRKSFSVSMQLDLFD